MVDLTKRRSRGNIYRNISKEASRQVQRTGNIGRNEKIPGAPHLPVSLCVVLSIETTGATHLNLPQTSLHNFDPIHR